MPSPPGPAVSNENGVLAGEIGQRQLPTGIQFESTRLILPPDLDFPAWETVGLFLHMVESAASWWIGDWINYGEDRYGEKYAQAMSLTGQTYGALANKAYTARHVEPSRRRENLSFSHHQEVASLPPEEQDALLDEAEQHALGRDHVRTRVQEMQGKEFGPCPMCGGHCEIQRDGDALTYLRR